MKINPNFILPFNGIEKKEPAKMDKEEHTKFLTGRLCEVLSERVENEVPQNGKFGKISASINVLETQNKAMGIVEYDPLNPKDLRRFSIGVHRENSDRLSSIYLLKGTKKEIIEYLKNPDNQDEIIKTIDKLSKSTDEYYLSR